MAVSSDNNFQSCIVAPTEILADQHYLYLKDFVPNEELVLLKSSLSVAEKNNALKLIKSGQAKFIVGTHSLFQPNVIYKFSQIVIDEQHRFGVEQRKMMEKGEDSDVLILMYNQTLSSILLSDYDVSTIDRIEHKKQNIETSVDSAQFDKL